MKPSLSVIIGQMKSDKSLQDPRKKQSPLMDLLGSKPEDDKEEAVPSRDKLKAAMQDLMMAFHKMDADQAVEAFHDVMVLCPECDEHADDEDYISNDEHNEGMTISDD